MNCNKCGANLRYEDKFCRNCGASNEQSTSTSMQGMDVPKSSKPSDTQGRTVDIEVLKIQPQKKTPVRKSGLKIVVISIAALVLVATGIFAFRIYSDSAKLKEQLKQAEKYLQDGNYEDAVTAFKKVVESQPKSEEAMLGLGKSYKASGRTDEALNTLKEALDLQPKNIEAIKLLASVYITLNKPDEAQKVINEGLKIDSKNSGLMVEQAKIYEASNKADEALKLLKEAINSEPKSSELYIGLANIYLSQFKYDDAINTLETGIEKTGNDEVKKALEDFKNIIKYASGNTPGGILNDGKFTVQGEWVYSGQKDGLYKWKLDGTNKSKIIDGEYIIQVNVIGDWAYYLDSATMEFCKVKTDGTFKSSICPGGFSTNVVGDWIYYCAPEGGSFTDNMELRPFKMYKVKTDGTGKTEVCEDELGPYYVTPFIYVDGDWIYYNNASDDYNLYKIKTDGTGRTKCFDGKLYNENIVGGFIYYRNGSDNGKLYKMKLDGSGKIKLSDDDASRINVSGDWIYYLKALGESNYATVFNIYRIKTDGTGRTKVCGDQLLSDFDGNSPTINVAGDWVYYINWDDTQGTLNYRIKTDGTQKQVLGND